MKDRKFVDTVTLYVTAGKGGNGCMSFRREKFVPLGGPDGGDGGKGGDVVLRADKDLESLVSLFYAPHQRAESGGHGKGKKLRGRCGNDLVVKVPRGTEIREKESGELVADLVQHGSEALVATGGKGGQGNCHWLTTSHQAPREHTDGEPGEEKTFRLKLKTVADVGLVGYPNAGKSSLLTAISNAHPKIAAYPFTTLHPVVGTVVFEDYSSLKVTDIAGLTETSHLGSGMGHEFLRHIERCGALLIVIDMAGVDGRGPADDYFSLLKELEFHKPELAELPTFVVANKMDLDAATGNLEEFVKKTRTKPIAVSALAVEGIEKLKEALHGLGVGSG